MAKVKNIGFALLVFLGFCHASLHAGLLSKEDYQKQSEQFYKEMADVSSDEKANKFILNYLSLLKIWFTENIEKRKNMNFVYLRLHCKDQKNIFETYSFGFLFKQLINESNKQDLVTMINAIIDFNFTKTFENTLFSAYQSKFKDIKLNDYKKYLDKYFDGKHDTRIKLSNEEKEFTKNIDNIIFSEMFTLLDTIIEQ